MSIKKFDEASIPTPNDVAKNSPFAPKTGAPESKYGKQAWSANGSVPEGKFSGEELADALLVQAEEAYAGAEELVKLYDRAIRNPTRQNVTTYSNAVHALIESDKGKSASVVSILVATLVSVLSGPRR